MTIQNSINGPLPLAITKGGTGQTTVAGAFNAISPATSKGDLIVSDGTVNIRLPLGADGQTLAADSTQASGVKWATSGTGTVTSVGVTGSTGLTISGSPITSAGTITATLGTELQALSSLGATGLVARTGAATYAERSLSGTAGTITISNGDGVAGNPTATIDASYSGQASITTVGTLTAGLVPIANGGTGQTTANAGFNALSPNTSKGDITAYDTASNVRIPAGANGTVLSADSASTGGLKWVAAGGTGTVTSVGLTGSTGLTIGASPITSSGTLTATLGTELQALSGLSTNGVVVRTGAASYSTSTTITVPQGGTGVSSTTAYGVVLGGTTTTGALQNAGAGTAGQFLGSNGSAATPSWKTFAGPTSSKALNTGTATGTGGFVSGTYTTPANVRYLRVTMVGGGGGGGGSGTSGSSGGGVGGNTTFGVGFLVAGGGGAGGAGNGGGTGSAGGGGAATMTGLVSGLVLSGSNGNGGSNSLTQSAGGGGGSTILGGAGGAGGVSVPGTAGAANTGGGGGAGGGNTTFCPGSGGGGGGGIYGAIITTPASTYAYSVGAGGSGGASGGGAAGGAGGSGSILVEEFY